jgi:hypothetical protein
LLSGHFGRSSDDDDEEAITNETHKFFQQEHQVNW